jgi:hypothetical protein
VFCIQVDATSTADAQFQQLEAQMEVCSAQLLLAHQQQA